MSTWDDKPNDYEHALAELVRLRELLDLAIKMRLVQKTYFLSRNRAHLVEAKQLERQFDERLAQGERLI